MQLFVKSYVFCIYKDIAILVEYIYHTLSHKIIQIK